jgi:hypothetical protein
MLWLVDVGALDIGAEEVALEEVLLLCCNGCGYKILDEVSLRHWLSQEPLRVASWRSWIDMVGICLKMLVFVDDESSCRGMRMYISAR